MDYISGLVSVVIPTHNRSELLKRAVLTALKQDYKSIEVIVVSDGSDDDTDDVMNQLLDKHDNLRYISYHPGKGGNHARNEGIRQAKGEWVAFLDDDDEWHSDKISKQIQMSQMNADFGLICTAMNSVYDDSGLINLFIPDAPEDSSKEILIRNCVGSTTTVMVLHRLLDECEYFDEDLRAMQDYDMWIRLCQVTKVGVVQEACVEYHNLPSNGQISWNYEKYAEAASYLETKYKELRESKLTRREITNVRIDNQLIVARKAMKAQNSKKVREYAINAMRIGINGRALVYYIASFFSLSVVRRVLRTIKGNGKN